MITTGLLIDHQDAIGPLSAMMQAAWPSWYNAYGASARADLTERIERDQLPVGIVALRFGEIVGTCALTVTSGGLVTERSPWLGGLLVDPAHRRNGVGAALLARARREAGRLGYSHLYALTAEAGKLFLRDGWRLVEVMVVKGEAHEVYSTPV